ncbi:hypothetical protein AMJ96_CH02664 [Rhizobium sp. N113]|uniref:hypothetical protein n=1 Tax=unclassified Rhizobium TaxID=2613769 RepID=UPI0007EAAE4F|nr:MULTISPECIES: hypothetical protein [unclassified Rhizobium]ANL10311.1 hypothetical protein AMJ98_CH02659 [Rhizobium sp. N1341]ANL22363.1 hypothetical protein AMJ96_CH02664 [Rhizobium sp. N113]ANM41097.1 hypothetical protein AMK03_CH02604 [Rhizobium sp. N741]
MKKLTGFDLNGWRDSAARNWVVLADGEEREVPSSIVDGGLNGVVVTTGAKANSGFVGGAQAALAPHGLGDGWGTVGAGGKRVRVRRLISGEGSVEQLSAAFRGMAPQADFGVGSLDDHPGVTELQQERLLAAMRKARNGTPLLVWRSVLAALHAIELGVIEHGQLVGIVSHVAGGFTVQKLRIRRESSRGQTVLAPERRAVGKLMASELGYEGLAVRAKELVLHASQSDRYEHLEWAHAHGRITLGLDARSEVLRLKNGSWEILNPPKEMPTGGLPDAPEMSDEFQRCDVVLFESLTEGALGDGLLARAASAVGRSPLRLAVTAVAQGALTAARRLSRREPVYFDFLPQISTIVQRRDAAENFDLIDPEATLPAGSVYRSPSPARLAIQAGQDRFSIFLRKETADLPRKAEVVIGTKVSEATPVDLWVEQSPASGRAKILVHAQKLGNQFQVDWDGAAEIPSRWEDLLDGFKRSQPSVPGRLVLPCGLDSWNDNPRGDGLLTLLSKNVEASAVDWTALAKRLAARPAGRYAISSDGEIPLSIGREAIEQLNTLILRAVEDVRHKIKQRRDGTDSIRFLTWLFRRCPEEVSAWLLDAWDQEQRGGHPIFKMGSHWKLAYQGLGRVASGEVFELRAIRTMLSRTMDTWKWQRETAAMAFLLSRSEIAPRLVNRTEAERIAKRVLREFKENLGSTYTRFQYAPLLLVGLLRYRLREPFALVIGQDPVADRLGQAVETTLDDLAHRSRAKPFAKYGRILEQTLEELRGEGSNPELLLDIFGGGDEDEPTA